MKKIISYLLFAVIISFSTNALADQSINGRVYVDNTPAVNVTVAVYYDHWTKDASLDQSKRIAQTTTSKAGGAISGTYEIKKLPAGTKLMVVATFPKFPTYPAVEKFQLKPGENKKIILTITLPQKR